VLAPPVVVEKKRERTGRGAEMFVVCYTEHFPHGGVALPVVLLKSALWP